jgi:phage shock protein E
MNSYKRSLRTVGLVLSLLMVASATLGESKSEVGVEAWKQISRGALLVDVRSPEEYASGHIDGAINIPHDQVADRISEIGSDKGREIVVYCKSGRRAGIAKTALNSAGFEKVLNGGGYDDLAAAQPKG